VISAVDRLTASRIVPVVEISDVGLGLELARTLTRAGLPAMEVTLRTASALDVIREIAAELPEFLIGAGTLLTPGQIDDAVSAGAQFGVAPGFTPTLSAAAAAAGLPFVPGAVTASEILAASEAGHTHIKFFPAERSGGVAAVSALSAPFASAAIRFMPTGGINPGNLDSYLALSSVFAIGGTWIAPRGHIADGRFHEIYDAARDAVATVAATVDR
jgi:2-dehydro-3-deoxyphosphogluconate aldolase/(4S)-4-hydroxy-2-oxoglutarate aldolase